MLHEFSLARELVTETVKGSLTVYVRPLPYPESHLILTRELVMAKHTGVKTSEEIDEASVKEWVGNYLNYLRNGDVEGWSSLWDDDVIILPPNMPPVHGLEAWRRMIEPSFGKYSNSYETIDLKIYAEHTMAYVRWIGVATTFRSLEESR